VAGGGGLWWYGASGFGGGGGGVGDVVVGHGVWTVGPRRGF
jgi:hypothetical protein